MPRGGDGNIFVRGAEGTLQVDGRALLLSNFSGLFGEGRIYGVSGTIPLKAGQDLKIIGKYALQIKDLNQFNKAREIEATGGSAEGTFELAGRIGRPFQGWHGGGSEGPGSSSGREWLLGHRRTIPLPRVG